MIRIESQHDLSFPPETVWPVLRQTDWINRSLGLPPVKYNINAQNEGGSIVTARTRMLGTEMRWREFPFEWLEPEYYHVHREFETGPFTHVHMGMEFHPTPGGGTHIVAFANIEPRNAFGRWAAKFILGPKSRRDMTRIADHAEEYLKGRAKVILPRLSTKPVNNDTLQAGLKKLRAENNDPVLLARLEEFLHGAPDIDLTHIRPFAIARKWDSDPWEVLRLFLHATHCGLLDFSWEILCPNCRTSREPGATSLVNLRKTSHCDVCQIKFDGEFDKSVELKFAVNPSVRPRETQTFCLAGPGGKPHIIQQLWLEPGEVRPWQLRAQKRFLRLRSPQVAEPLTLIPGETQSLACAPEKFFSSPAGQDRTITNPNKFPVLLSVEQMDWSEDILTAARVTNWQEFRDLFSAEVISPSEQVTVGSQVVLFTDLRGSTAMYHGLGDASAYVLVRNHFVVLIEAIRSHHGTVVKTIGDAVMATFSRVDEALAAIQQMFRELPTANPGLAAPLVLKSGLHVGSCLAVNANDKLDYFGTTINLAARLVECSKGGDLTVSESLYQHPDTAAFLKKYPAPEPAEVTYRGFVTAQRVWRIKMVD